MNSRQLITLMLDALLDDAIEYRNPMQHDAISEARKFLAEPEPDPTAYLILFEGAGKLLEFTKGNYLHGAKVEHIPLFTHPASKPAPLPELTDEDARRIWLTVLSETQGPLPIEAFARAIEQAVLGKCRG